VLCRGGLKPVSSDRSVQDRGYALGRHLAVGLVLEPVDIARHPAEDHERAGARPPDRSDQIVHRESIGGDAGVDGPAADRRDQRELIPRDDDGTAIDVLAIEGDPHGHALDQLGQLGEPPGGRQRVIHGRAVGQLDRDAVGAGALAQDCEQSELDLHAGIVGAATRAVRSRPARPPRASRTRWGRSRAHPRRAST
jgi:hypothetical protein